MHSWRSRFIGSFLIGIALTLCPGCSDPNAIPLHPVGGTVTLDGEPLVHAAVMFLPRGSTRGNACLGYTDDAGQYSLAPERDGGRGAPEGEFDVIISKRKDPPPDAPAIAAETDADELLSPKYWNSAQTILKAKVPRGGVTIDFPLVLKP